MGYVAIRGGEGAILEAARLLEYLRAEDPDQPPVTQEMIEQQMRCAHSRVLSEGGLYDPRLAALALKQTLGDTLEAAFFLRAFRSTRPRLGETSVHDTAPMRLIRRISAAFKDIPGGQILGPTTDYIQRLFRLELLEETGPAFKEISRSWLQETPEDRLPSSFPKVVDALRAEGLLAPLEARTQEPFDITRQPMVFPLPRSGTLMTMARAETGSILAIAYSNMRGYGDIHPTIAELRVGYLPVEILHPITRKPSEAGEVLVTECEVVAMYGRREEGSKPVFGLGYGVCFGHNEVKAISMAVLDRALQKGLEEGPDHPSEDQEFVLLHIDGIESMGFCTHYKMPHYVTFQSDLDRLRETQKHARESGPGRGKP